MTFNEIMAEKSNKNVKVLNKHEGEYSRTFRVQGWGQCFYSSGTTFFIVIPFPMDFPALPSMMHRVWNQIWTFCPFLSEISQLCEPPSQARNLDMGLLIAWVMYGAVERAEIWEFGGWGGLWFCCSFTA